MPSCLCALLFLTGCQNPPGPNALHTKGPYYGDTLPLSQLISKVNDNNRKLPTLWARHWYEATIVDDQKKSHFVNGDGVLFYRSPDEFRIIGSKELVGTVFDLGTNADSYWLKVVPEIDTLWYGRYADVNPGTPLTQQMPIDPNMLSQVLAIEPIDDNLNNLPAPTLRFNNDARAYMVVWNLKLPDRWVAQREVWYDVETLRPLFVFLFDANGRVVLRAKLSHHWQVTVAGMAKKDWPWMPGQYSLFFPGSGSQMQLTLEEATVLKGDGARSVPNDRSFISPDPAHPDVGHVIPIR